MSGHLLTSFPHSVVATNKKPSMVDGRGGEGSGGEAGSMEDDRRH